MKIRLKRIVDDSYEIRFIDDLGDAGSDIRRQYPDSEIFVITDDNVEKLYAGPLVRSVFREKTPTYVLRVPPGESSKDRRTKEHLENEIIARGAGRSALIVALGGGVIGDLAGFIAATLHRGVPFIQIPTSLLAQVDSSIGGKVAIDHPEGKNLIGAFFQPKTVYIGVSLLTTLPEGEYRNGMAEVIKYAAILDRALFLKLEKQRAAIVGRKDPVLLRGVIERCCDLKRAVVEKDEREADYRRILNFGHTIGHALEQVSGYRLAHGEAVSIGMAVEARLSCALGLLPAAEAARLEKLLTSYGLPTAIPTGTSAPAVFAATARDKKAHRGKVHYTLLEKVGTARVGVPVGPDEARELFEQ